MITMTQIEYILAVENHRHFGKAAEACHVSQPSLSAQIQKAEEELGWQIFDRIKKPVVPTEKGKAYIEQAKVILHEYRKLEAIGQTRGDLLQGELRLGIIPTISPYLVPLFLADFAKHSPDVKLRIDEMKTETILKALKEDQIDAAILATPLHEKGLKKKVLFYEPFYLMFHRDHELRKKSKIAPEDLDAGDMWLLQDGHCFRNQVMKICALKNKQNKFKNVSFEGGNLETLRYLIQSTQGTTLIPHLFRKTIPAREAADTTREFTSPVPTREVSLVYRREQWKQDMLKALSDSVLRTLPEDISPEFNKKNHRLIGIEGI